MLSITTKNVKKFCNFINLLLQEVPRDNHNFQGVIISCMFTSNESNYIVCIEFQYRNWLSRSVLKDKDRDWDYHTYIQDSVTRKIIAVSNNNGQHLEFDNLIVRDQYGEKDKKQIFKLPFSHFTDVEINVRFNELGSLSEHPQWAMQYIEKVFLPLYV